MRRCISTSFAMLFGLCFTGESLAQPLAESYLLEGRLADGEKALSEHLAKEPRDDQARFGLGVVQFLQTFEHFGGSLFRYGLRTDQVTRRVPELQHLDLLNPQPEKLTYAGLRQIVQTVVDDLMKAERTLAEIKDPQVKLPLRVGLIKLDPFGQQQPVSAAMVLGRMETGIPPQLAESFAIGFDRGDVSWLRGYCHFLAAWGELLLALDGQELFNSAGHLFFAKTDSPYVFLQERNQNNFDRTDVLFDRVLFSDILAYVHLMVRLGIAEPQRMQAVLAHLEAVTGQAQEMWRHYSAEMDDDNEWIPNPKQSGVLQVAVSQEMVDAWLATVHEAEQVLQGKRLLPFWRGAGTEQGVNLRRVFTDPPRELDPILWVQGTAAVPYLEQGPVTQLADPRMLDRLNDTFGGTNFVGFAFWFN